MNFLLQSIIDYDAPSIFSILLSATCIGNDGRSCPLFHGSLAPMIFGKTDDNNMRLLLLESNNITWTQTVLLCDSHRFPTLQGEIFQALSKTRYSSKSLKTLQVLVKSEENKRNLLSFLQTVCEALETLVIRHEPDTTLSLKDLASCPALTNSLNRLMWWSSQPIPDLEQFQHFTKLQELRLYKTSISDEQLHSLASLKNLRQLEIISVSECTGSFLDVVCPSLERLRFLEITNCSDFNCVSGLKHLANSLEEVSLNSLPELHGHEEWVEFPLLKTLQLVYVAFDDRETFALSSDAFPSLEILEIQIARDDRFYSKFFESCQRKSSTPIKRVNILDHWEKEDLEALLMVPVEELYLYHTGSMEHLCSDILWSEEKTITKTLKKFKWEGSGIFSSISFLIKCKKLEHLQLGRFSPDLDLSPLSNLPFLKELSFAPPVEDEDDDEEKEKLPLIKDLFRSAVVLPSLQKLELIDERALSLFEGLENIIPNLRILESSTRVGWFENDKDLLNSFLYLVRNFQQLEEIRFNPQRAYSFGFNTRIPRLLKQEKPSLSIYYPGSCQYESEPEKEETRGDCE